MNTLNFGGAEKEDEEKNRSLHTSWRENKERVLDNSI